MVAGNAWRRFQFNSLILIGMRMEEMEQKTQGQTSGLAVKAGILFGIILIVIGILNIILIHVVPGVGYLLISMIYFPFSNDFLKRKTGHVIPGILKILLAIVLFFFTLGVSDLGDLLL